jgi:serine/threonine protein kinase
MVKKVDEIDRLVAVRFDSYEIDRKDDSLNARHYVLQRAKVTYHLKLVTKAYIDANEASEIELLKVIKSDNIIELLDSGDLNNKWVYLLFPHINGTTLDKMHTAAGWNDDELGNLFRDVLNGFKDLAKAKIVHRDIKPKNIIYDNFNKRFVILDLGIGYFAEKPNKDNSKIPKVAGPKFYTAPEQFKIAVGEPFSITQATDQFSLGIIAYELATNSHPYITYLPKEAQSYASLVLEKVPEQIPESFGLSNETKNAIMKMLHIQPSQRFLTVDLLLESLGFTPPENLENNSKLYYAMPNVAKDQFIEFIKSRGKLISGVIITPSDSQEYADKLNDEGINAILDPKTYSLQVNESSEQLSKKLGVQYVANHYFLSLYKLKDSLLVGALELSEKMHSEVVVLPYFKVEDDGYVTFTKEIWSEARALYESQGRKDKKIFGSIIIPHNTLVNEAERNKLMSMLMGTYPIDGIVVTFENTNKNAATTTEAEYINGVKSFCHFFESIFSEVVVNRGDMTVYPLTESASFVAGWSKSFRHFMTISGGGGGGNNDYKMKYFAPKLFTFIEEKSTIQTIILMGKGAHLHCNCVGCKAGNPLLDSYTPDELKEREHFYNCVADIQAELAGKTVAERKDFFIKHLNESSVAGNDVKSSGLITSETIPSYVGLVTAINN